MDNRNLGCQNFEGFMSQENVQLDRLKIAVIGAGQCGGKMAAEMARLNFYSTIYNTCKEDIDNIKEVLEKLYDVNYKIIQLKGYNGASKDRELGKKAIKDNLELLKTELMNDQNIIDADFVWIIAGLGGGTGNGSLDSVSKIVSGIMRNNKRYRGKPTVGIIATIPEDHSKQKIKLNAALAVEEIKRLHESGLIGATLLISNEKLINDYLDHGDESKDWTTYGNVTTARLLAELNGILSLPGRETLDPSEYLDIITTPGFLTVGKMHLKEPRKDFPEIIKESFTNHNLFADGYDYSTALHGGMAILRPFNSKIFGIKDTLHMKRELSKFLSSPMVELTHFGVYDIDTFGTYKNPQKKDEALIYTLAVTKSLPKHILKMTQEALELEKQRKAKLSESDNSELFDMLSSLQQSNNVFEPKEELTLDSIFGDSLFENIDDDDSPIVDNPFSKL